METSFKDDCLICYFSWGRLEYIERTLFPIIENMRSQDRLLVVDQEMHCFDFYAKHRDKIDYLVFFKRNYRIGPIWELFKYLTMWLQTVKQADVKWSPEFINIIESDALIKQGDWVSQLVSLINDKVKLASGYLGEKDPNSKFVRRDGKVLYKDGTQGVNVIVKTEDFLKVSDYPNYTQDHYFSQKIDSRVACLDLIEHIGVKRRKEGFF